MKKYAIFLVFALFIFGCTGRAFNLKEAPVLEDNTPVENIQSNPGDGSPPAAGTDEQYYTIIENGQLTIESNWGNSETMWFNITSDSNPSGNPPGLPPGATMPWANGFSTPITTSFSWTPSNCQSKNSQYSFKIKFWSDNSPSQTNVTNITVINVNRPPTITGYPNWGREVVHLNDGYALEYVITPQDIDKEECGDDTVDLSYSLASAGYSLLTNNQGTYRFLWIPIAADDGKHELRFWASDQTSGSEYKKFTVYVHRRFLDWNATENSTFTYSDIMNGSNSSESLSIQPGNLPQGATMPQVSGMGAIQSRFSWTPTFCQTSNIPYEFTVDHYINGQKAYENVHSMRVNNTNRPPIIQTSAPATVSVKIGERVTLTFNKSDPDRDVCHDDTVSWGQVNLLPKRNPTAFDYSYSGTNNDVLTWTWKPMVDGDIGSYNLTIVADDGKGKFTNKLIKITAYKPASSSGCGGKFQKPCT